MGLVGFFEGFWELAEVAVEDGDVGCVFEFFLAVGDGCWVLVDADEVALGDVF